MTPRLPDEEFGFIIISERSLRPQVLVMDSTLSESRGRIQTKWVVKVVFNKRAMGANEEMLIPVDVLRNPLGNRRTGK